MRLTLKNKKQETSDVFTLTFTAHQPVFWVAGQSIRLELPVGSYDIEERRFTISSAPYENVVAISTRVTPGIFKRSLLGLQVGDAVEGGSIEGKFVWRESATPHCFIAAGIGITPFYSMLKERAHHLLPLNTRLLFADSTPDLPFLNVLTKWQHVYPEFTFKTQSRRVELPDIDAEPGSLIYISGPTLMVQAIKNKLTIEGGVSSKHILTDQFTGYTNQG